MSYKIILVDDHAVLRTALKQLIEKMGDYVVTNEYDSGREFVDAFPFDSTPDLLILDLSMPDMDGSQVVKWMKENNIPVKTLVLTVETDEEKLIQLFRMGIRGYLNKNTKAEVLQTAIKNILETGYYHNDLLVFALTNTERNKTETEKIIDTLTDRERLFLTLVYNEAEYTYEQIADQMSVKLSTVEKLRLGLFEKFQVKSKTGLLIYAIRHKLLPA